MSVLRAGALLLLLVLWCGLWGCGDPEPPANGDGADGGGNGWLAVPTVATSLRVDYPAQLNPLWTKDFEQPVIASVSADGTKVVLGWSAGRGRYEVCSARSYDASGTELWSSSFRGDRYRAIRVQALGSDFWGVAVFSYSDAGVLHVYESSGRELWSRDVRSDVLLAVDRECAFVYCIDRGNQRLFVLETDDGRVRAELPVGEGASLQVAPGGRALVGDRDSFVLVESDCEQVQAKEITSELTSVVLAPSGDVVYVATAGADSSAYRFGGDGELIWRTRLPGGGSNSLAVSPEGDRVVAYNVSSNGGFVVLDAADGKATCRVAFNPLEDSSSQFIRWVKLVPGTSRLLADYAVARRLATGHAEEHSLLLFDVSGQLLSRFDLGANVDVIVSDDCSAGVLVGNVPLDWTGPEINKVRFYDLRPFLGRE